MKMDLNDTGILLIVRIDTKERLENAIAITDFLVKHFNAPIYMWEIDAYNNGFLKKLIPTKVKYTFCKDYDPILHRTRYINKMVDYVQEPYVAIWDIDVIAHPNQIKKAVELLRNGADFSYPYETYFCETSVELRNIFLACKDIEVLIQHQTFMNELYAPCPAGGVFFANRHSYIKSGKETEAFYGWGVEDGERYHRWEVMKMKIERVSGPLFHLTHPRGINSQMKNPNDSIYKNRLRLSAGRGAPWNII